MNPKLIAKLATQLEQRKQVRLAPLKALGSSQLLETFADDFEALRASAKSNRTNSARAAAFTQKASSETATVSEGKILKPDNEVAQSDLEESICCDSDASTDSDEYLPSPRQLFRLPREGDQRLSQANARKRQPRRSPHLNKSQLPLEFQALSISNGEEKTFQTCAMPRLTINEKLSIHADSSDKENEGIMRFSPPQLHRPESEFDDRPITPPPASPSKSKLVSPSKKSVRVPKGLSRPSLDAFWTSETVNDWNDQYSPQKIIKSPRKLIFSRDKGTKSPPSSPRKMQSPSKPAKAELDARKNFKDKKVALAESFLNELDQTVTDGKIQSLATLTGGVKVTWSKTLNSTAGRANWRCETTRRRHHDGTISTVTHKHFATIELAEKVIDDEHRLLNVIAHEFCHLANFMVSGIKDKPHGSSFQNWGRIVTQKFSHRSVEVTTKHSFEIDYKYIWQCDNEDCGQLYKRHSKSIDLKRHKCGLCSGLLVQIKPVPKKSKKVDSQGAFAQGGPANVTGPTGYAGFVKAHFAALKRGMPGATHKEVMEALGKKYRAEKQDVDVKSAVLAVPDGRKKSEGIEGVDLRSLSLNDDEVEEKRSQSEA